MRRLLLISLIMLCQIGQAQTIDGFTMGKERMAAVRNVPKGFAEFKFQMQRNSY